MTPEIERLAKEAGVWAVSLSLVCSAKNHNEALTQFAALLAGKCAAIVEDVAYRHEDRSACMDAAAAIRAKFALSGGEAK